MEVFVAFGLVAFLALFFVLPRRRSRTEPGPLGAEAHETSDRDDSAAVPIDGVLDLHHFRPAEVGDVVDAYLDECRAAGVLEVRLIHGKGKGVLRRTVHARLERRADVRSFGLATDRSGWGATLVELAPAESAV